MWVLFLLVAILQTLFSLCQAFFGKNSSIRQWAANEGGFVSLCMTTALAVSAFFLFPRPERSMTICAILGAFALLLRAMKRPGYHEQTNKLHHPTRGQWVKLTPLEMDEASRKRQRGCIVAAVFIGSVIFGLPLLSSSRLFAKIREEHPHSPRIDPNPFMSHGLLPQVILFSVIGIFFYLLLRRPGKSLMICPKCGAAKYDDGSLQCKCCGRFEDMKSLKWEE